MKSRAKSWVSDRAITVTFCIIACLLSAEASWLVANTRHNVNSRNFKYGKEIGALQSYKDCNDWAMMTAFMQGFDAAMYLSEGDREKIRMDAVAGRIKTEKEAKEWFDSVSERIAKREGRYFEKHKGDKP
jgi:hypothetical protein